jgi:hypothetical protein
VGQIPNKYFLPSSPYGASPAASALNPSQPAAQNPQTPLLPPNFNDPGTIQKPSSNLLTAGIFGQQQPKQPNVWQSVFGGGDTNTHPFGF